MKTKEELNAIIKEVEELNVKLSALSEEELSEVTGGVTISHGGFKQVDFTDPCYVGQPKILQCPSAEQFEGDSKKCDPSQTVEYRLDGQGDWKKQ